MRNSTQTTVPLSNVATVSSGGTPSKQEPEFWGGDIPWVSAKDMKSPLLSDAEDHVTSLGVQHGAKLARSGDILVLARGMTLHQDVPICFAMRPLAFNQDVKGLRPNGVDGRFLFYALKASKPELLRRVDAAGHGTGRLNTEQLKTLPIPRFGTDAETDIADMFSALDNKIELNRRIAATLEEMARALYRSWFLDFDPVRAKAEGITPAFMSEDTAALFPDRFGDNGLPRGWGLGTLSDLIQFNPKETLAKGSFAPYIDMKALPTYGLTTEPPFNREFKSGTKFCDGDVLLARITPCLENGKTGMVDGLGEGVVGWGSTEFIVMRSQNGISSALPYCVARTQEFRDKAITTMTGSSGRQRADASRIAQISHALPPEPIMAAFNQLVSPMLERVLQCGRESHTLANLRDSLLPRIMSGDLRVGEAKECVEEVA